jgi:adenylate cyclase
MLPMSSTRQLSAIMFTDIVGYTSLMGNDEKLAISMLNINRQIQRPVIESFGGRWIKELGDGVMAIFPTVSDAIEASLVIQEKCREEKKFQLRIGVHHGEIIVEEGDIFGDAVNIAARVQAIAPPGGIYITEAVRQVIQNNKDFAMTFSQEANLKNVREPLRLFEVVWAEMAEKRSTTQIENKIQPIIKEDKISGIAVLPFVNMSSDPEQEYFSDGLTEEIITDLSHIGGLLVISRSSMMTYKGTSKKLHEIAREVKVRYMLEGSVRKAGNQLRITAQLIDAENDCHVWAEKYNGSIDDVFKIQEQVSRSIAEALNIKLSKQAEQHLSHHPIVNLQEYEFFVRARQEMWKFTQPSMLNAISLARKGIELNPRNASLHALISTVHLFLNHYGVRNEPSDLQIAKEYCERSLQLDADCSLGHFVKAGLVFREGKIREARKIFQSALDKDPNNPELLHWLIVCYMTSGNSIKAGPLSEKLIRVDPFTPPMGIPFSILFFDGQVQASLPRLEDWLEADGDTPFTRYWGAVSYAIAGQNEKSIYWLDKILKDTPGLVFVKFAAFFKPLLNNEHDKARAMLTEELLVSAGQHEYTPIYMAMGLAILKDKEGVMNWLLKSLQLGVSQPKLIENIEPIISLMTGDPAFENYMDTIRKLSADFLN